MKKKLAVSYKYQAPDKHIVLLALEEPKGYQGVQILNLLAGRTNFNLKLWEEIFSQADIGFDVEIMSEGSELKLILTPKEDRKELYSAPFRKDSVRAYINNVLDKAIALAREWKEDRTTHYEYVRVFE